MSPVCAYILSAVIAYLLGSVSTGLLVARLRHGPDLRQVGSQNTGASNVLRTMGVKWGLITFVGDFLKAALACLIADLLTGRLPYAMPLAGVFCILGHNWPVFFGFKGGKGVASSCGVMVMCFPVPALISYALAVLVIWLTRYISLGSLVLLISYAALVSVFWSAGDPLVIGWACLLALLCVIRHHGNISRLLNGTERRIGEKAE